MLNIPLPPALLELYDFEAGLLVAIQGRPHRQIAAAIGMAESQYYRLLAENDLFKQGVARAREQGHEAIADSVLTLVDDNQHLTPHEIKIKFDTICKWLGWMNPDKYSDRMTIKTEHVDLKGALDEAKSRIIDVRRMPNFDPFEE